MTREELAQAIAAVKRLLAGLGDTADAVAVNLAAAGITGLRRRACSCPVFNYLAARVPAVDAVDGVAVLIDPGGDAAYVQVPIPPAVMAFILQFDTGRHYPGLAQTTEPADPEAPCDG